MTTKLTVLFEDPFWIGLFERTENGKYQVARVVFGAEPTDLEVFRYILENGQTIRYSEPTAADQKTLNDIGKISPKRLQRMAAKEMKSRGKLGKAFEVIRLEREKDKKERKSVSSKEREMEIKRKFELKQQKKKEKHKGH